MKREELLVTTAIEETWELENSNKILFLGENCKIYDRKKTLYELDYSTLNDPWSDRENRKKEYIRLEKLYEFFLRQLTNVLNHHHQINESSSYWRILIGPWLKVFLNSVYHQWKILEKLHESDWRGRTLVIKNLDDTKISSDMEDFYQSRLSDAWNHHLCSSIIQEIFDDISIDFIEVPELIKFEPLLDLTKSPSEKILDLFRNFINKISITVNGKSSNFFHKTYLTRRHQSLLYLKMRTLPYFTVEKFNIDKAIYNKTSRLNLLKTFRLDHDGKFENFFYNKILEYIPINYFEGFEDSKKFLNSQKWPENPKSIITANSHWVDEIFKLYAADKVSKGSKLKLIVHGGHGKAEYSDFEKHEIDISDKIFSWGWLEYSDKIIKGFYIKDLIKPNKIRPENTFLHVMFSEWRYVLLFKSSPSYQQVVHQHMDDQLMFLSNLRDDVRQKAIIKPMDKVNFHEEIFSKKFSDLTFVYREIDFNTLIQTSKVVIHSYNETTIVETLANNIPTIAYWNHEHWEQCPSSTEIYKILSSCGIVHSSAAEAAAHLNSIWDDVESWWQSDKVREAVSLHNNWYARKTDHPIKELVEFIDS